MSDWVTNIELRYSYQKKKNIELRYIKIHHILTVGLSAPPIRF